MRARVERGCRGDVQSLEPARGAISRSRLDSRESHGSIYGPVPGTRPVAVRSRQHEGPKVHRVYAEVGHPEHARRCAGVSTRRDGRTAMTLPTVSIVVAVYNAQHTIEDCLDSLLALDYPEARREVIVVDNGSCDASPEILDTYAHAV